MEDEVYKYEGKKYIRHEGDCCMCCFGKDNRGCPFECIEKIPIYTESGKGYLVKTYNFEEIK